MALAMASLSPLWGQLQLVTLQACLNALFTPPGLCICSSVKRLVEFLFISSFACVSKSSFADRKLHSGFQFYLSLRCAFISCLNFSTPSEPVWLATRSPLVLDLDRVIPYWRFVFLVFLILTARNDFSLSSIDPLIFTSLFVACRSISF